MTIHLHVERLVLEGIAVDGADRVRLERAVVAELTRLLTPAQGVAHDARSLGGVLHGGALVTLPAGQMQMQAGQSAAMLGVQIAQSVVGVLRGSGPNLTPGAPSGGARK